MQNIATYTSASLAILINDDPSLSMLTPGTINSFQVVAVDTSAVGEFTKY
jgi:hypothetical protein